MSEIGVERVEPSICEPVRSWYRSQCRSSDSDAGFSAEIVDEAVWLTMDLRTTALHGTPVRPFVLDLGATGWMQGWANGDTLTIACPPGLVRFAAHYLELVTGGSG